MRGKWVLDTEGKPEVDVFIPKDIWDNLSETEKNKIETKLIEIYNIDNLPNFSVDFRQLLTPMDGWPDPAITNVPGAIIFKSDGSIAHEPFGK